MVITKEQSDFIKAEFDLDVPHGVNNPVSEKLWDLIRFGSFMVEGNSASRDGKISDRCRIAVSICDMKY